jgi:hypothetical protein
MQGDSKKTRQDKTTKTTTRQGKEKPSVSALKFTFNGFVGSVERRSYNFSLYISMYDTLTWVVVRVSKGC